MRQLQERIVSDRVISFPVRSAAPRENRRATPRARCLIEGRVLFPDHARTRDVMVRNRSAGGAMLAGEALDNLPDHFTLALPQRGEEVEARLRWADYGGAGVEFA